MLKKTTYGLKLTYKGPEGSEEIASQEFYPNTTLDTMVRNVKGLTSKERCDLKNKGIKIVKEGTEFTLTVVELEQSNGDQREPESDMGDGSKT